jgi:hypothetical protein
MKQKAQISMETMAGFGLFLLLFLGISALVLNENGYLNDKSLEMDKKDSCLQISQAFYEAKNSRINWQGTTDWNVFVSANTIYIDYNPGIPFQGIYCETLNTGLATTITKGDLNLSYELGTGFIIQQ